MTPRARPARWAARGCVLAGLCLLVDGILYTSLLAVAIAVSVALLGVTQLHRPAPVTLAPDGRSTS